MDDLLLIKYSVNVALL